MPMTQEDGSGGSSPDALPAQTGQRQSRVRSALAGVYEETGMASLGRATLDIKLLFIQKFFRMFAYGGSTLVLVLHLRALGVSESQIGLFMTLTLVGDVALSLLLTIYADRLGRKNTLIGGALLVVGSGVVFAVSEDYWVLLTAAILGVISPSGNEIGPFRAIEESIVAHLTPKPDLGSTYAWYNLVGRTGGAFGIIVCGWLATALQDMGHTYLYASKAVFIVYSAAGAFKMIFTLSLGSAIEAQGTKTVAEPGETAPLLQEDDEHTEVEARIAETSEVQTQSSDSKGGGFTRLMISLTVFFFLDNFASGLLTLSWLTYYFKVKFDLGEGVLGSIFFTTSIISALSSLVAAWIAKRLGNVKTMVFTHLPSSIMLGLIPIPSELPGALTLVIARSCSQQMDVGPRTAFLALVLPAEKRTATMGYLNVVKTASSSIGPSITGALVQAGYFWVVFVVAGVCKVMYDLGMLATFAGRDEKERDEVEQ